MTKVSKEKKNRPLCVNCSLHLGFPSVTLMSKSWLPNTNLLFSCSQVLFFLNCLLHASCLCSSLSSHYADVLRNSPVLKSNLRVFSCTVTHIPASDDQHNKGLWQTGDFRGQVGRVTDCSTASLLLQGTKVGHMVHMSTALANKKT